MAPRPFLVSGGSEDPPERWKALNHAVAVNKLLGVENRVAMTNRKDHSPNAESNEILYLFFESVLKPTKLAPLATLGVHSALLTQPPAHTHTARPSFPPARA